MIEEVKTISAQELLSKTIECLGQKLDLNQTIPQILANIKEYLNCEQVFISQHDRERNEEIIKYNLTSQFSNQINYQQRYKLTNVATSKNSLDGWESDGDLDENTFPLVKAELSIPMEVKNPELQQFFPRQPWGFLVAYDYDRQRVWREEEIKILKEVVSLTLLGVERAILYDHIQVQNQQLEELKLIDETTELANYRAFIDSLEFEWARHIREKQPLSLIIISLNYIIENNPELFKVKSGEILLKIVESVNKFVKRFCDLPARYQENKLAVILPNTPNSSASLIAEKIQSYLKENLTIDGEYIINIGLSTYLPQPKTHYHTIIDAIEKRLTDETDFGIHIINTF